MRKQPKKPKAFRQCPEARNVLHAGAVKSHAAHGAGRWWGGWRTCGGGGRERVGGGA